VVILQTQSATSDKSKSETLQVNYFIEKAMAGESVSDMADVKVQIEEEGFQATLLVGA
jgi:hypothetical protein